MTITEVTQIGTLTIAAFTSFLALRTFSRSKKQELENQLFKIKLEAVSNITCEIDNFFICLNRCMVKLDEISETVPDETTVKLKSLSLEIDEQIYKCHTIIVKNSVYFSQKSMDALLSFTNNFLGSDSTIENTNVSIHDWLETYSSKQADLSDNAIRLLRDELRLEQLHHSLFKRSAH